MPKEKMEVKFQTPRVHFSKSGAPYTRVEDIFHSERGQKIISRMAMLRGRDVRTGRIKPNSDDE